MPRLILYFASCVVLVATQANGQVHESSTQSDTVGSRSTHAASQTTPALPPAAALPTLSDWNTLVADAVQKESKCLRYSQTLDTIALTKQLRNDPRFPSHTHLRKLRSQLAKQLKTTKHRVLHARRKGTLPTITATEQTVLAQLVGNRNGGRNNGRNVDGGNRGVANQTNPQAANADYGMLLVQLIQDTISPASWDANGGNSTIRYWRPGMALVVRAPDGPEISLLLEALRAN